MAEVGGVCGRRGGRAEMEDRVAAPSASCCPWVPDTREGAWARSEAADTLRGASQVSSEDSPNMPACSLFFGLFWR